MSKIIILALWFFLPNYLAAQHSFGIRGGTSFSQNKFDSFGNKNKSDVITGLEIGIFGRFFFYKNFFFQPEISFIQKGGIPDFDIPLNTQKIKTNYLGPAVLLGYEFTSEKHILFGNLGTHFNYLLNQATTESFDPLSLYDYYEVVDKNWDVGLISGVGAGFLINNSKLILEVRYNHSFGQFRLINAGNNDINIPLQYITLKNRGWGLNLSYTVSLTK